MANMFKGTTHIHIIMYLNGFLDSQSTYYGDIVPSLLVNCITLGNRVTTLALCGPFLTSHAEGCQSDSNQAWKSFMVNLGTISLTFTMCHKMGILQIKVYEMWTKKTVIEIYQPTIDSLRFGPSLPVRECEFEVKFLDSVNIC